MDFLKRNANVILVCVLEVIIGILLLVNPVAFTSGIIIVLGVALVVAGIMKIVEYFRTDAMEASLRATLVKGLVMLLGGAFLALKPSWLVSTFPVLTIVYGVVILFSGLYKVQWFVDALRLKTGRWFLHVIDAVLTIVCAVIILANPFEGTVVLWRFIGITLIIEAVMDILVLIFAGKGAVR